MSNDTDVSVLLREWDIERFFQKNNNKNSPPRQTKDSALHAVQKSELLSNNKSAVAAPAAAHGAEMRPKASQPTSAGQSKHGAGDPPANASKPKHSFLLNFLDKDHNKGHKRQDSDSKLSLNFVRGFRRENTDFFPLSKRHSAILGERQSTAVALAAPQRASVIYPKNSKNNGEPILTDFVSREYLDTNPPSNTFTPSTTNANKNDNCNRNSSTSRGSFFLGPRREKTESVILRNSTTRQQLLDQQQVNTHNSKQKHIHTTFHSNHMSAQHSSIQQTKSKEMNNRIAITCM